MKPLAEIKKSYTIKINSIIKEQWANTQHSNIQIGNKKFDVYFGNYLISAKLSSDVYLDHPLIKIEIKREHALPSGYSRNIFVVEDEQFDTLIEITKLIIDYWVSYLKLKEKPLPVFFHSNDGYTSNIYEVLNKSLDNSNHPQDLRAIYQKFPKRNFTILSEIPEDVVHLCETYSTTQGIIDDFFEQQKLISIVKGDHKSLYINEILFDFCGKTFKLFLTKDFSEIVICDKKDPDNSTQKILPTLEHLDAFLENVLETNKLVHLFTPPDQWFKKFVGEFAYSINNVSDETLSQQYSYLENYLGSWQKVELYCQELSKSAAKGDTEVIYSLTDKVKKRSITIEQMEYQDHFLFFIIYAKHRQEEFELFISKDRNPVEIKQYAEKFFLQTFEY